MNTQLLIEAIDGRIAELNKELTLVKGTALRLQGGIIALENEKKLLIEQEESAGDETQE